MTEQSLPLTRNKYFSRENFLELSSAALAVRNYRFLRDATLVWLSNFPGDLTVGWYYAQSVTGEGRYKQAWQILRGLWIADPEFEKAAVSILDIQKSVQEAQPGFPSMISLPDVLAGLFALTGNSQYQDEAVSWGIDLWLARQAIRENRLNLAEESLRQALINDPPLPLPAVVHLQLLDKKRSVSLENRLGLAKRYRQKWPDCLAIGFYLAEWLMEGDDSHQAVALLHQLSARDISGQVASRLWGAEHPYRHLWPDHLELALELKVPADVTAALGWNRLPAAVTNHTGEPVLSSNSDIPTVEPGVDSPQEDEAAPDLQAIPLSVRENPATLNETTRLVAEEELENWLKLSTVAALGSQDQEGSENSDSPISPETASTGLSGNGHPEDSSQDQEFEVLQPVNEEFDRMSKRLRQKTQTQRESLFPIYVIFSLRSRLESIYREQGARKIHDEMTSLAKAISSQRGWGARIFLPDDATAIKEFGIKSPRPGDAWGLKLALSDLDIELCNRGEMIGAVLIVGGSEVVPYHRLPNPLDDPDVDVPSDCPYSTRDENYFIPEWPVGRLPGGGDGDAQLLIDGLQRIAFHHTELLKPKSWYSRLVDWIHSWRIFGKNSLKGSFGYSAAIWKTPASRVFSIIGKSEEMVVSPPAGLAGDALEDYIDDLDFSGKSNGNIPTPAGNLGYFNLHGVSDAVEWFGHRDPLNPGDAPEFPIALRPQDLRPSKSGTDNGIPKLVFSEACYGAHIEGKTTETSLTLKFLDAGTMALVGSTSMSYGTIFGSLSAADLLASAFWRYIQEGLPAGEALCQAKIDLIRQMDKEQGFLDGQDQKTLISFNLFGDPLTQPLKTTKRWNTATLRSKSLENFEIVCDRNQDPESPAAIPDSLVYEVKQIVARYLPGMSGAHVAFTSEHHQCAGDGHQCPTSQFAHYTNLPRATVSKDNHTNGDQNPCQDAPRRGLVTLSKQVRDSQGTHPYFAHLTLEEGKLVKLVVSR